MADLFQLAPSLGGLHDARLVKFTWHSEMRRLEIFIDDLYSNFEGLPEYQGPKAAVIVFDGVERLAVEIDFGGAGLMVYDCTVNRSTVGYTTQFSFSPSGRVTIDSKAASVDG